MDSGTAAAIKEAGLTGKVFLATSGGGEQKGACDQVKSGAFDLDLSYDVPTQASNMASSIKWLLQNPGKSQGRQGLDLHHLDPDHQGQRRYGGHLLEARQDLNRESARLARVRISTTPRAGWPGTANLTSRTARETRASVMDDLTRGAHVATDSSPRRRLRSLRCATR